MPLPTHLEPHLEILRKTFPDGVSDEDYRPLLALMYDEFSEENLGIVIAELVDGERVVVVNDAIDAFSKDRPPEADIERIRQRMLAAGWDFDDPG